MRDDMREIRISTIKVRDNIRRGQLDVADLVENIRERGLLQPILVRRTGDGHELVAGHRRLAACKALHMESIPAMVTDSHDSSRLELQLAENVQREELSPYDIALALRQLRDRCDGMRDLARRVRKSGPWVSRHLDFAVIYESFREAGFKEETLDRIPYETLWEFKAVPAGERAALLRQIVSDDREQKIPSKPQFRRLIDAKRTVPREKRKADQPAFDVHTHGLNLTLVFKTKLDIRRITQLLLEHGGRRGL